MDTQLTNLQTRIEELGGKAEELMTRLQSGTQDAASVESLQTDMKSIQEQIAPLVVERDKRLLELSVADTKAQVQSLTEALDGLRSWNPEGLRVSGSKSQDTPYTDGEHSFFNDVRAAKTGDRKAYERLLDAKAMTEGTDSAGGYLVTPEISSELVQLRIARAPMRSLFSAVAVNSDTLQIASQTGGLTAGWVAELATKPQADMTFGQFSTSVFTAAGLAVVSNQLLADAGRQSTGPNIGIDSLIVRDLAKRLAIVEEVAFINGSGTGQPLGLLGTGGVNTVSLTATDIPSLLDAIVDAILDVQTNFLANPTHIVMHPRTWARILKARESTSPSTYLIGAGSTAFGRRGNDALPGGGALPGSVVGELFGYPVVLTSNMPTNLGTGTNESRVIVGDFSEGLILDRQGVTVDTSEHVFFTSNQTVFRAEMRVGFTAARYPKAFSVIQGAGLAAG